jgi:hypothetical protein
MDDNYSSIQREREDRDFTVLNNQLIRDKNISPRTRWFISYCLSFPENWKISVPYFIKDQNISKDIMYSMIDEAIEAGYIRRETKVLGGLKRYRYFVASSPKFKKCLPCPEKPDTEKPDPVNPDTNKERISSYEEIKKKDLTNVPRPSAAEKREVKFKELPKRAEEIAAYLLEKRKTLYPKLKDPRLKDWAIEIDRMERLDGRQWDEIERTIDWAYEDSFWVKVILSASNLREHYDRILVKRSQVQNKGQNKNANRASSYELLSALKNSDKKDWILITADKIINKKTKEEFSFEMHPQEFVLKVSQSFGVKKA